MIRRSVAIALLLAPVACSDSSGPREAQMFDRFLIIGGSAAAGVESGGINQTTQSHAWPAVLAQRLGFSFTFAELKLPGCPAPTSDFYGSGSPSGCAGLVAGTPPNLAMLSSAAIPGARMADAFAYAGSAAEAMNVTMLGSNTQLDVMVRRNPTFVAVQFGDDELQSALLTGDVTSIPMMAQFRAEIDRIVNALHAMVALKGVLLVGVMDPTRAPALQPGAYFFLARDPATGRYMGRKPVNNNCSPVTALGTPNPLAGHNVSFAVLTTNATEVNCAPTGSGVLTADEIATIRQRVTDLNNELAFRATANGWAFLDVQALLQPRWQEIDANNRYPQVRRCQQLPSATTAAQFQAAVLNSCPVVGPTGAANFFGALFTYDGKMLSAAGHVMVAEAAAAAIQQKYPSH